MSPQASLRSASSEASRSALPSEASETPSTGCLRRSWASIHTYLYMINKDISVEYIHTHIHTYIHIYIFISI